MLKTICALMGVGLLSMVSVRAIADTKEIPLLEGEKFWGGCVTDGRAMPFDASSFERDLFGDTRGNQAQPLLGLMGYAYTCHDMIGGGEYSYFYNNPGKPLDQELIVRSAQCSALMPMMQFSVAPWRVLSAENMKICRDMALLHEKMGPEILTMAKASAKSGEPIVRHMEYMYPHQGYAVIKDQFLLGDSILVAPVLKKGARSRTIVFPAGSWRGDDGSVVEGPCAKKVDAPLARLPWYRKVQ